MDCTLRNVLAELYLDTDDARRVAGDAGLDLKQLDFGGTAIIVWTRILEEADKRNKLEAIVCVACQEYPDNDDLCQVAERLHSQSQDVQPCWEEILRSSTPIANLTLELQAFLRALQHPSTQPRSILLIEAGSGKGKTELLDRYRECCESGLTFAHVDLKGGSVDPLRILQRILDDLTSFDLAFPRCAQALGEKVVGRSLEQQKQHWVDSITAFQQDLRDLADAGRQDRIVLLLDTFEQASDETREWIGNELLRLVKPRSMACPVIVVAGQRIPEPPGECRRHCQVLQLKPPRLDDWLVYSQQVRSILTPEQIRVLYDKHWDKPLEMTKTIQKFVLEQA